MATDITTAWREWVEKGVDATRRARRRLLVQIINANRLSYRWESYDKAAENMKFMGVPPSDASESIGQALQTAQRLEWNATKVRKYLR